MTRASSDVPPRKCQASADATRAEHGQQRGSEDEAERGSARVVDRPDDEPGAVHSAEEDNERGTTRDNCPVPLSSFFLQKILRCRRGG